MLLHFLLFLNPRRGRPILFCVNPSFCSIFHTSLSSTLLPYQTRNGIYPMTAFGLPSPQKPQQEAVKSPVVIPLVKPPSPEPAEFETRRVGDPPPAASCGTFGNQMCILMLLQVVHMQCNVEPVEEGTKFHVSFVDNFTVSVSFNVTRYPPILSFLCFTCFSSHCC